MANEAGTARIQKPTSVRGLRLLVGLLVVSNLLLGGLSAYLLHAMDRDYTGLIDHHFPLMRGLRQLTKETVSMQRHVLAALVAPEGAARRESLQGLEAARMRQRSFLANLLRAEEFRADPELSKALAHAAQTYEGGLETFLALLAGGRRAEANELRNDLLRPTVNGYLDAIDQAAAVVEASGQKLNDVYTGRARTQGTILVGLASWPLMVGLVILAVVAAIIGVLVLVYRRVGDETI